MDVDVCDLCATAGGTVLWESPLCRIVCVDDADYPCYCRVIWNAHVRELSDLEPAGVSPSGQRARLAPPSTTRRYAGISPGN